MGFSGLPIRTATTDPRSGRTITMQLTDAQGTCWDTAGLGFSDGDPDAPCRPSLAAQSA